MKSKVGSFTVTLSVLISFQQFECYIIGNFVLPHGGIALDPSYFNATNQTSIYEAHLIHNSCIEVGKLISSTNPDLIFLSTPHGISDLNNFAFYLNPEGYGTADTDNCNCPPCCYSAKVTLDNETSLELVDILRKPANISGLSCFGYPGQNDELFPLRWGELIPLHFLPNLNKTKVVILSQPSRRYTESVAMIPELLELGGALFRYLDRISKRVVVIISADLAHTHLSSGPYGYSDAAEPFDQAMGNWASTMDGEHLLITGAKYVDKALSCGYTGLVMLHGMMHTGNMSSWQPKLYANYYPSYYGMMVASFLRKRLRSYDHDVD